MFRIALISMFLTSTALADTWTVDDDGKADFDNIQDALDAVDTGDVIAIAAGTYNESDLYIEDADITITGEVNAKGEPLVTIDGGGDSGILIAIGVAGATGTTVENIVFTGSTGNALWIYHHNPTIRNCVFTGNVTSSLGGALWSSDTEAIIENCRFVNNTASNTGSIFFSKATKSVGPGPTIRDCVFENNTAYSTAVIQHCNPVIEQCTFENNTANYGGGMYNHSSSPTLTDCTFENNTANYGGGMFNSVSSNPTLTGTTVCGNTPEQIIGDWTDNGGNTVADECECVGDINLDSYINVNDLLIIIGYWGNNTPQADLNFDGIVDVTDLLIVVGSWGECE
ncbi:MAG: hypothetical protein CMJ26_00295 [Phycisphaerae bacterium]|nr:hypothetical protein [Phycisphaerae bacterium]